MISNKEEKKPINRFFENLDWILLGSVVFLVCVGLLATYSATLHYGNPGKFFTTQLAAVVIGLVGLLFFATFNYQFFRQSTPALYAISCIALVSVLIFGTVVRGTKGWFNFGYFSFQPVEVVKILFILVIAGYLDRNWREMKRLPKLFTPLAMLLGLVGLILMQPDFSSTLVFFPITLILLFVAGVEPLYLLAMMLFGTIAAGIPLTATFLKLQPHLLQAHSTLSYFVTATRGGWPAFVIIASTIFLLFTLWWFITRLRVNVPIIIFIALSGIIIGGSIASGVVQKSLKEYQRKRLIVFVNPEIDPLGSGYNIIQSKIAIGSGRFLGKGLFSGTQSQLGFLPEQHTDFIFSLIAEETGYFFTQLTLFAYFLLVWRAMVVARESRDRFGSLVSVGIAAMFAFYAIINIGMVMGMMPATGLPLPLLSYGGSCMVSALWAVGILFSVHIRRFTH